MKKKLLKPNLLVKNVITLLFVIFTSVIFAQGNTCATATSLTINGTCDSGTISDTTENTPLNTCGGTFRREGWYTFTVTGGPLNVTITASGNRNLALQLISSSSSCTGLTQVSCTNDAGGSGGSNATETVTTSLANGIYYIKALNIGGDNNMTLSSICVTSAPAASGNLTCATATALPCGTTALAGTTVGSTGATAHGTGCSMSNYGAWYTFIGDGQSTTISSTAGSGFDHEMSISSGSCGSLTSLACQDSGLSGGTESYTFTTTVGVNYYVYLAHWSSGSSTTGTFTISRSCVVPCTPGTGTGTTTVGCPTSMSGGLGLGGVDASPINCTTAACVDLEVEFTDIKRTTSYSVASIPYAPPYQFGCLTNPVSVNVDDVWSPVINLPFTFCFYGNTFNSCMIGSNGVLSFDTANAGGASGYSFSNNLPSTVGNLFANSIYGVYHDIDPSVGGEVGWELITLNTGCRALVASWNNVPMFSDNTIKYTGMMVLYENTNVIEVYIKEKKIDGTWNGGNAIVGLQNAAGTAATVAPGRNGLSTNWTATNEAWRFTPNGASVPATVKWYEGVGTAGPVVGTTAVINVCPSVTTDYTAEITYTLCNGLVYTNTDVTTVTVNKDKTWDGSTSTNWNTAANWTPTGVPLITESVTIPNVANDPIVGAGANALACSLNIETGAVLTVNSGKNLTVTNSITVATGGTFNVMNAANLVQVNDAAINTGNINMQRITNVRLQDYSYWSTPVGTLGAATFPVQSISPATPAGYIFKWGTTTPNANGGQGTWVNTSENMIPAKGYILRAPNGFTNAATSALTANFIGTPNNGIFSPTIYRGTDFTGTGTQGMMRTATDDNWNLVGNPYPSSIGVNEFLTLPANNTIVGGVRIWTHGQLPTNSVDPFYENYVFNYYPSDYITINLTGATSGPGDYKIGAGQGFMVLMNAGAAGSNTITFNNSLRNAAFANNVFYRNSSDSNTIETIEQNRIWLDLVASTGAINRMLVGYVTNATQDQDRLYDSFTDYKPSQNFYSLIEDEPMTIQGRALPFDVNDRVPLGVTIPQNGTYSIAISALDGLFKTTNQAVYIQDTQTNTIHDLKQNPYSFSAVSGNDPGRFVLRYTNETLGNDDFVNDASSVWVSSSNELTINSSKTEIKSLRVFDVLGRELANYPNVNSYEVPLTKIQKNNSGLIIQVTLTNGAVISKKTIY